MEKAATRVRMTSKMKTLQIHQLPEDKILYMLTPALTAVLLGEKISTKPS